MTLQNNLLFLFLLMALFTVCKKESVRKETEVSQKEAFKITIASGGGFTGLYKGYTLHSEGQVMHWQRFAAGRDSTIWAAQGAANKILNFKLQLEKSGAPRQTIQETGNMTTTVTLTLQDTSYTWSWPGTGVNDNTPDIFKEWYLLVEKYCKNLKK